MKVARAVGRSDYATAIRCLHEGMAANGENTHDLGMIAYCYHWMGSDQEALDYGTRVLVRDPCDPDMLRLVAHIYQNRGDDERAYLYLCRALENPPKPLEDIPRFFMAVWRVLSILIPRLKKKRIRTSRCIVSTYDSRTGRRRRRTGKNGTRRNTADRRRIPFFE